MVFSPTGTAKRIVGGISARLADGLFGGKAPRLIDFTLPAGRAMPAVFSGDELVVVGVPVYAGRVPNVLLPYLKTIEGHGATAVAVVAFGNRAYDDALVELVDLLSAGGLRVIAGAAFVGEHSFSKTLAKDRPDAADMALVSDFAGKVAQKVRSGAADDGLAVAGCRPYRPYYMPKDRLGVPVDIRKVKPKTTPEACTDCGTCAEVCPMGSIDRDDAQRVSGICIKCGACIKACPSGAKYYDDAGYLNHQRELEVDFARRAEPELFV
jgi:ferredoxin